MYESMGAIPMGALWYFHAYVGSGYFYLGSTFWVSNFGIFFSQKNEHFWGYKDFVDTYFFFFFFWGGGGGGVITKLDYI